MFTIPPVVFFCFAVGPLEHTHLLLAHTHAVTLRELPKASTLGSGLHHAVSKGVQTRCNEAGEQYETHCEQR